MTAVLDIVIPTLAIASIVAAALFIIRGFDHRSRSSRKTFGVERQKARQSMQEDFVRSAAAFLVGLILLGVMGLSSRPEENISTPTRLPTLPATTVADPTETPLPADEPEATVLPTEVGATAEPSRTPPIPTATQIPAPTEPAVAEPITATVNSEAGVWLRSIPSVDGEQIEWVLNGTILTLLPGLDSADDLEWQQARTPSGNEGWVAIPFITYSE